ncbi:MAG: hypothetical protein LBU73_02300, partial [Helicobacteraceae bacterium]|nr:hypothetical protein [Helicobacteraceae bacterium]
PSRSARSFWLIFRRLHASFIGLIVATLVPLAKFCAIMPKDGSNVPQVPMSLKMSLKTEP